MSNDNVSTVSPAGSSVEKEYPRDAERMMDISGAAASGRPKAHVLLRQYLQYSDGTTTDILPELQMTKPIVQIYRRAGFVNIHLDFGSATDQDLRLLWEALEAFGSPSNSVSYLDEEIESGFYMTPAGPKMVYYPTMDLVLSPIGREDSYMIHCYNPALWALSPNKPNGPACVVRIVFWEGTVTVVNDLEPVDLSKIRAELTAEQETADQQKQHFSSPR